MEAKPSMSADSPADRPGLALYAKVVVASVFVLIFFGGLVTSWGAGMAAPDWPLSFGSLNPNGWWSDFPLRLEHGHRLIASLVGILTLFLAGWVWRNPWIRGAAVVIALSLVYSFVVPTHHAPRSPEHIMQASLWVGAGIFLVVGLVTLVLYKTSPPAAPRERTIRGLALAAFIAVCLQATLGGLRVTGETAQIQQLALVLRIFHGCVAQAFLCIVVALATVLSPRWQVTQPAPAPGRARRLAWMTFIFIFVQLIFGAVMRHLGAALAIPTFPAAAPDGSWIPRVHNAFVDTNFAHTRIFAFLVALHVVLLALRIFRTARRERLLTGRGQPLLTGPAATLLALLAIQLTLGVFVILHTKPPTLTTFHVLNGAALLAVSLLLALRLRIFGAPPGSNARWVS
jgi:cytochrome c oxidase assembly protein subunit 15